MTLRPATLADADRLLAWRNDPLTRAMSINQNEVKFADHIAWLKRRLAAGNPPWIYEVAGIAVGTVRTRLKSVFAKTETHRQASLVRLLLSVVRSPVKT